MTSKIHPTYIQFSTSMSNISFDRSIRGVCECFCQLVQNVNPHVCAFIGGVRADVIERFHANVCMCIYQHTLLYLSG